ncbi:MAG: membrane protein insertase YidC [Candidatus Omnitrophica bacterium]|nr:membrane protein insertase YidC [Candidatus Omnitrophota bacterium]
MEKRLFIAVFITFLFYWVYSTVFFKPPINDISTSENQQQSSAETPSFSPSPLDKTSFTSDLPKMSSEVETKEAIIGKYSVSYSETGGYILSLSSGRYGEPFLYENIFYIPDDNNIVYDTTIEGNTLSFKNQQTSQTKSYSFNDNLISFSNSKDEKKILFFSNKLVDNGLDQRYQDIFYSRTQNVVRKPLRKVKTLTYEGLDYFGARDRYFCISLIPGSYNYSLQAIKNEETKQTDFFLSSPPSSLSFYLGPQDDSVLSNNGIHGVVHYGFFHPIALVISKMLYFFHSFTNNWGVSIILLAITIYGCLFPFTMKSTKAMRKMQMVQPEMEAIREKFKDNPQKVNKEIMALYKKHKVNPMGGCLPMFFQLPVFIALYQVLPRLVDLKQANFLWIKDLTLPDQAFTLPITIPVVGQYINVLPLLIIIISLAQQKFMSTSSTSGSGSQQKSMGMFMAVFIGIIFYRFPSCLVLYWFVQNLLTLGYQYKISKQPS